MAKTALVTQSIETGTAGSLADIQAILTALEATNNTEVNSLTAAYEAHVSEGLEAHGVVVSPGAYKESSGQIAGIYVALFPTSAGIVYAPASLSPAGISS